MLKILNNWDWITGSQLRTLSSLTEDTSLIPSIHVVAQINPSENLMPSSGLFGHQAYT